MNQDCGFVDREDVPTRKSEILESRYGTALTLLQQEYPIIQSTKRSRLLKMMEHFGGDIDRVRKHLDKTEAKQNNDKSLSNAHRHQTPEQLKIKYSSQLEELKTAGVNINSPCILQQLERYHGDTKKVSFIFKFDLMIIVIHTI